MVLILFKQIALALFFVLKFMTYFIIEGDSSSEQDEDGGDEKMVRSRRIKRKDYDYHLR